MKNRELIAVYNTLVGLKGHTGHKFGMFVARNIQLLKPEVLIISEEQKRISDRLKEYRKKQRDTVLTMAAEGEQSDITAKLSRENVVIAVTIPQENTSKFAVAMKALEVEHKTLLEEHSKEEADLVETMDAENANYKPIKIDAEFLPKTLAVEVYSALIDLISVTEGIQDLN